MTKVPARTTAVGVLLAFGAFLFSVSAQERTQRPGQPTQARVLIQNKGNAEAVPVSIEAAPSGTPLKVELTGAPTVTLGPGSLLLTSPVRHPWEYKGVDIPVGADPLTVLNQMGADGWEATGVVLPGQTGTLVVMKRPRS